MCPTLFDSNKTKQVQNNVRELFKDMTKEFRVHLMHTFMWSEDKLEEYLKKNTSLQGDELKEAYSHLESLLARIESFAAEKSAKEFPSYDEWVTQEFKKYKDEHWEDREDIERLMGEGGVVAPGPTSPMDSMANDSISHYEHQKEEFDKVQVRSKEAIGLMRSPPYQSLQQELQSMQEMIVDGINHRH